MLNPFLQIGTDEKGRKLSDQMGDSIVEIYGHSIDTASPRPSVGLWVGKLLIRMGEKLTKQNLPLEADKEEA